MLEKEGIPFEFFDRFDDMVPEGKREKMRELRPDFEHYQICYPSNDNRWISVIQGFGTMRWRGKLIRDNGWNETV